MTTKLWLTVVFSRIGELLLFQQPVAVATLSDAETLHTPRLHSFLCCQVANAGLTAPVNVARTTVYKDCSTLSSEANRRLYA